MAEQKFYTSDSPQLTLTRCNGDVEIRAGMESAVVVKGSKVEVQEAPDNLTISSDSDLKLTLPAGASLGFEHVGGDLVIKNVSGDLSLGELLGDAVLSGVGHAKINTIHGDLSAKNVNGRLSAHTIHGDAALRRVADVALQAIYGDLSAQVVEGSVQITESQGDISLRSVNGDVYIDQGARDVNLRNLGGRVTVKGVQGDIRLFGGLSAAEHLFEARGDIVVRWPGNAPLNFTATAPQIVNRLSLEKEVVTDNTLIGRIGDGQTTATFTAGGRFILKEDEIVDRRWEDETGDAFAFAFDFADLGEQISQQVNDQIARVTAQIETKFGADYADYGEKIAQKVARRAEEAARRVEDAAERMRQRAERQAGRRADYGRPPAPPPPAKARASSEEQIKILKMVEQGTISPDEAAILLEALENR